MKGAKLHPRIIKQHKKRLNNRESVTGPYAEKLSAKFFHFDAVPLADAKAFVPFDFPLNLSLSLL